MMRTTRSVLLIAVFTAFSAMAFGQEQGLTVRATDLKDQPFTDANTVLRLAENTRVEVQSRKLSWLQVAVQGTSGWVKMLSLRFDGAKPSAKDELGGIRAIYNLATTGSSGSTVTTDARGLDERKLRNPSPNPPALAAMRAFAASRQEAETFAELERLKPQQLDYVKATGVTP